jgi:hypothetical protein
VERFHVQADRALERKEEPMNTEKRNFARLGLHAKAYLRWDGQYIEGEVENVSIKGVFVTATSPFVAAARQMAINDVVAFTIDNTPACDLKAKVVRVTDKGMGLQFEKTLLVENGP